MALPSEHNGPVAVFHPFWLAVQEAWTIQASPAARKKQYQELYMQRAQQLLGHATSLAAITPKQRVVDLEDLFNLMRRLVGELLPEQDLMGDIRDKAIRFQCRNKSDIDDLGFVPADDPACVKCDDDYPGESRRGDVIRSPRDRRRKR